MLDSEIKLQEYREKHNIKILPHLTGESAIEEIKVEYARLQSQLANYEKRYTKKHPKMIELTAQLKSLRNKIQGLGDTGTGRKTMDYRLLERVVQSNKQMYETLLNRLKEIDLTSNLNVNNVMIIDRAEIPEKPVRPRVLLNVIMAVVAGLFGGILLGFFIEYMDTTIKSPEDVVEVLESHFLEAIPDIEHKEEVDRYKIMHVLPNSHISESYRSLRTSILNAIPRGKNVKTLLVTSSEPEAGKTITTANLSIALAQEGSKVLLIDCDLRKPKQHKIYNLDRYQGLSEYLTKKIDADRIIQDTGIKNLSIITSGKTSTNAGEIIGSKELDELLNMLRYNFDYIIIDTPPISSVTDSIVLANKVDAAILVIRAGKTHASVVKRAKEQLSQSKAMILGVVLNGLKTQHSNYYYYGYGKYYMDEKQKEKEFENIVHN